jgi:HAD superfamily hydrolase (TIGR01549 family)
MKKINNYKTILFDCDGVILDSNKLKSDVFFNIAQKYTNRSISNRFLSYHKKNGGISRFQKFHYLIEIAKDKFQLNIADLLDEFSLLMESELKQCKIDNGIHDLRANSPSNWAVISGGSEEELKKLFKTLELDTYFNLGIYGSPKSKYEIIENLIEKKSINESTLFIGDSKLDYQVAKYFNFDFVFKSEWSEIKNWQSFCRKENIVSINNLNSI